MEYPKQLEETVEFLQSREGPAPRIAIVLGSGLGSVLQQMDLELSLPYSEVPHFRQTTIAGHDGRLTISDFRGTRCCVLHGRTHVYEGAAIQDVVFPVRALGLWGVSIFILTNAAGAVNALFQPGQLMLVRDHLNLLGANPLCGLAQETLGARFPDMSKVYDPELLAMTRSCGKSLNLELLEGVYAAVRGPSYETPAEVRMLRILGADAVGMSTVPEAIALSQMKKRLLGISCITNRAAVATKTGDHHREILKAAKGAGPILSTLLLKLLEELV